MKIRSFAPVVVLLLATLAAPGLRAQRAPQFEPRHVRVVWTTSPQTSAVVSWSTVASHDTNAVVVGLDQDSLREADQDTRRFEAHWSGAFTTNDDDAPTMYFHHARLDGLEPSTTYWFEVVTEEETSAILHFTTAPADDRPFAVLSGGDSRTNRKERQGMNRRIAAIAAAHDEVLAFAHGGDYVGNGRDFDQWKEWLEDHELTTTKRGRVLPIVPARGNHEGRGALYDEIFDHPGGDGAVNWYATSLSADVLLITLNSETDADGDQREFLAETLTANADRRWKVAQYHRPLFPAVKGPGRAKSHWQPLFDEHRLDLAFEADGHTLKRTVPILGEEPDPDGVVYIGEGGLGVGQRKPKGDRWYLLPPGMAKSVHHVWLVRFTKKSIELAAIGIDGETLDRSRIPAPRRR